MASTPNVNNVQLATSFIPSYFHLLPLVVVQSLRCIQLCHPMDCSIPGLLVLHYLLEFAQIHVHESVMPTNHLIFCHPLHLLPSIFPRIGVFSNESVLCIRWPKYQSFSCSINLSNEYSGLISFRMDWLDLLAVQGTLNSLLQHHSSKASILQCSAFLIVQLSHWYMTTRKTIALTWWTFVGKVMSLLLLCYLVYWRRWWHPTPVVSHCKFH